MAHISFAAISKSFGATAILKGISLDVADGEFLTLLGPSGCGKSTLLRILAGLEAQDAGSVAIGNQIVDGLRPKRRDVAMVFQTYALYPHMTVAANMALPLRMRRLSPWQRLPLIGGIMPGCSAVKREIDGDVRDVAAALGIDHLLARKPGQLSGGQRQRVAVGRAMVRHPAVFLMDEPLSNLDAKLRVQMRTEIKDLHRRLGTTFIYVTHDQAEAMTLSDRVAVMLDGELLQVAPPQDIYAFPESKRVAEFIGSPKINLLNGVARKSGVVEIEGQFLAIETRLPDGTPVTLGVRPEAFFLAAAKTSQTLSGSLRLVEHMGSDLFVHIERPGSTELLVARLAAERAPHLTIGQSLHLGVAPARILLFARDDRRIRTHAHSIAGATVPKAECA